MRLPPRPIRHLAAGRATRLHHAAMDAGVIKMNAQREIRFLQPRLDAITLPAFDLSVQLNILARGERLGKSATNLSTNFL
jgi:hypothetical protein